MILSTRTIDLVADRIERAYYRRHADVAAFTWNGRVWSIAARALLEQHRKSPWLPLDPELFVASQCRRGVSADPWSDLAPPHAVWRYRRRVTQIVRRLRRELKVEIARAERRIARGEPVDAIARRNSRWFSPIGRYILAYSHSRLDLCETLRQAACQQHEACPLYRRACVGLLPLAAYPAFELVPGIALTSRVGPLVQSICLN